jgi:hypothetical protein
VSYEIEQSELKASFSKQFYLDGEFPLVVRGRLASKAMIHLCIRNNSGRVLYISNEQISEMQIEPKKETFKLIKRDEGLFSLMVREEGAEPVRKTWKLDESIMMESVKAVFHKNPPLLVGAIVKVGIELPPCSYSIENSDGFAVVGRICRKRFEGGSVIFQLVPTKVGVLETPRILVNGISQTMTPEFVDVTAASALSYGPFIAAPSADIRI